MSDLEETLKRYRDYLKIVQSLPFKKEVVGPFAKLAQNDQVINLSQEIEKLEIQIKLENNGNTITEILCEYISRE